MKVFGIMFGIGAFLVVLCAAGIYGTWMKSSEKAGPDKDDTVVKLQRELENYRNIGSVLSTQHVPIDNEGFKRIENSLEDNIELIKKMKTNR